ncbi:dihydroxyacetone kinase subunit DhaL [Corynebacterium diphtheriae]
MVLDTQWALAWIRGCARLASEHREELIDLDRAIGDADHGENVDRGFAEVVAKLDDLPESATPADILKVTAQTLISTVGGASGPLLGTAFLRASKALTAPTIDASSAAAFIAAALEGIQARGKANEGEKTMVDAWAPAAHAAATAADEGASPADVLARAAAAASQGAADTESMVATKGRASYLGERSVGHRDPGATSSAYFLQAAADAASEEAA